MPRYKTGSTSLAQAIYSDFSGGYNDTSAAISIEDNQLAMSENADYAAEVKALQTRKGCSKVNEESYNGNITDGYSWLIGSVYKKCIVKDGKLYDLDLNTGNITYKLDLSEGATHIYPFVVNNTLFFGDGTELWSWGAFDFSSELGTHSVTLGTVVRCNDETLGTKGHFYRSLEHRGAVDLKAEKYSDTTKWTDVTDVPFYSSSDVRPMKKHDPSKAEQVLIEVTSSASANGTINVVLGAKSGETVSASFTVTANESVPSIVSKMNALKIEGWTSAVESNGVLFTSEEAGARSNAYVDPSTTNVGFSISTKVDGKEDDCNLDAIKKCTIFCVHQGSQRVFAGGNPEDSALWFSEIGYGNYWKSEINKVYPAINGYGKVTAMTNLSDSLLVSYESGWYSWKGTTPLTDAYWKPLNLPYGCVNSRCLCLTPNSFTFLAKDGLYCISAALLSDEYVLLESGQIINKLSSNVVEKTIAEFVNKSLCEAIFYENVFMLSYSTNGQYCDKVLKFEWNTGSFTLVTGWRVNRWLHDPEDLYFASKNYILKAFQGYSDIDVETGEKAPINLHVKTKEFHFGTPMSDKVAQLIGFVFQQHEGLEDSAVNITVHAGYNKYRLRTQDLSESLLYGRKWGKVWGYREAIVRIAEMVTVSNTFQIEFENNNVDDPITLIAIGFIYRTSGISSPNIYKDEELLQ